MIRSRTVWVPYILEETVSILYSASFLSCIFSFESVYETGIKKDMAIVNHSPWTEGRATASK